MPTIKNINNIIREDFNAEKCKQNEPYISNMKETQYNWDSRGSSFQNYLNDVSHQDYVVYTGCKRESWYCLPDIDLMDLPINGSSVAIAGSLNIPSQQLCKLPIKTHGSSKLVVIKCTFCQQKVSSSDKVVELPCKHYLHFSCIKKWIIISNPCRKCNQK